MMSRSRQHRSPPVRRSWFTLAAVAATVLNLLICLVFMELSLLSPPAAAAAAAARPGLAPAPSLGQPLAVLAASGAAASRQQQQRPRPTFRVGICAGDSHDWVPTVLAPLIFPEADAVVVPLRSDGDERAVDLMMCYRGATAVVARKAARSEAAWLRGNVERMARSPWRPGGSAVARVDGAGAWRDGIWWPKRAALVRDRATGRPLKPFVLRMNTEPWVTGVEGVDLMVDCKRDSTHFLSSAPAVYIPYAFAGFGMRFASQLSDLLLPDDPRRRAAEASVIAASKTKFCAFIASYCSARVASAAMRSVAFDLLASLHKVPDALGNCRPRTATTKGRKLKVSGHFANGTLDEVVAAYRPYKFALCFENSQLTSYVTEKIISAALARTVPIYWGAPDVAQLLNPKAFVHCDVDTSAVQWDVELKAAGGDKYALQDSVKARFGTALRACLRRVKALDEDPVAYAAMLAEPLLIGNSLEGSELLDVAVHARNVRSAMLAQGFRLEGSRGGGGATVWGGVSANVRATKASMHVSTNVLAATPLLRGHPAATRDPNAVPTCGIVLNAVERKKEVLRAGELAGRLRAALRAESEEVFAGGAKNAASTCEGGLDGVKIILVVESSLWEQVRSSTREAISAVFDAVHMYNTWVWRADDAALELEYADRDASARAGARRLLPALLHETRPKFFKSPRLWLLRISATLRSPFDRTMLLDNDAFPCAGIGAQFEQLRSVDVAAVEDGFGGSRGDRIRPFSLQVFGSEHSAEHSAAWKAFPERNLGFVLLATGRRVVRRLLRLYLRTYVRLVNDLSQRIMHDQTAFRQALFALSVGCAKWYDQNACGTGKDSWEPIRELTIAQNVGCRPYATKEIERLSKQRCAQSTCAVMHCHDCGQWSHPAPPAVRFGGWHYSK